MDAGPEERGQRRQMTSYSFTLISDLHGWKPTLPGGDLLIIAGDLIAWSTEKDYDTFKDWVVAQPYSKTIIIPGNHDTLLQDEPHDWAFTKDIELLIDQATTWNGIKFYGSPWTLRFPYQNPLAMAFTCYTDSQIEEKWLAIPQDTNVLITHMPPHQTRSITAVGIDAGSKSLLNATKKLPQLKLHAFGHIHESRGAIKQSKPFFESDHIAYNAAMVDRRYKPHKDTHFIHTYSTKD